MCISFYPFACSANQVPGGLQPHQLRVYEDFLLAPASAPASGSPSSPSPGSKLSNQPSSGPETPVSDGASDRGINIQIVPNVTHTKPMPYVVNHGTVNQPQDALARRGSTSAPSPAALSEEGAANRVPPASPPPSAIDKLGNILHELEKIAARVPASYTHLPPDHEVPQMIALIPSLTSQLGVGPTQAKLEATSYLVQRILSRLFDKSISMLLRRR